jgi:hypothetical protein
VNIEIVPNQKAVAMKDIDDIDLKAEIDQISKKIDTIVQQVEKMDPARQDKEEPEQP